MKTSLLCLVLCLFDLMRMRSVSCRYTNFPVWLNRYPSSCSVARRSNRTVGQVKKHSRSRDTDLRAYFEIMKYFANPIRFTVVFLHRAAPASVLHGQLQSWRRHGSYSRCKMAGGVSSSRNALPTKYISSSIIPQHQRVVNRFHKPGLSHRNSLCLSD